MRMNRENLDHVSIVALMSSRPQLKITSRPDGDGLARALPGTHGMGSSSITEDSVLTDREHDTRKLIHSHEHSRIK